MWFTGGDVQNRSVFSRNSSCLLKMWIENITTNWLDLKCNFILRIIEMTEDFSKVFSKSLKCWRISWFLVNKQFKMPVIMVSTLVINSGFKACVKLSSYYSKKNYSSANSSEQLTIRNNYQVWTIIFFP